MTSDKDEQSGRIAFGEFLAYLRAKGFVIGVDQHLRLQQLLERIEGRCAPEEVKTLICPLFATSRDEQQEFYRVFDEYFAIFKLSERPAPIIRPDPEPSPPKPKEILQRDSRALIYTLLALLSIALITFVALLRSERFQILAGLKPLPLPSPRLVVPGTPTPTRRPTGVTTVAPTPIPTLTPTPTPPRDWVFDYRWQLRFLALAAPLLLFALWQLWLWVRRRPVIEKAHGRRPPFTWPIDLEPEEWRLDRFPIFYQAARGLRRRQIADFHQLDLPRTIGATIAARGYPSFRYRQASRVPEYLVLIDRASRRDHQARLFDQLAQALEREGLFVARYFYEGDPRICRSAESGHDLFLAELFRKYPAHRLVMMGDGARLLDPVTGEFSTWAAMLTEWPERAILTPVSLPAWRWRERVLSELFTLLPATLAGLADLAERYDTPLRDDSPRGDDASIADAPPDTEYEVTVDELRRYLGPDAFQWLCACAVYPELQWELTLKLGQLIAPDGAPNYLPNYLDEAALWRLLRLPWFRQGTIPDEIRLELVRSLDPALAKRIREFLIETLERNPAEEGTFASDERRLDIAVQKAWLAGADRRKRKAALKEIGHLPPGELQRDYTLVRLLEERPTSLLALVLPARFRKIFYPEGLSHYGMKWQAVFVIVALAALLAWGGVEFLLRNKQPHQPPPPLAYPLRSSSFETVTLDAKGKETNRRTLQAQYFTEDLDGVLLEMVRIPAGEFVMGSPENEAGQSADEGPQHSVKVPEFFMGRFEVTREQWRQVAGMPKVNIDLKQDPSYFKDSWRQPVESIDWEEAVEFCLRLQKRTNKSYRLPSEAEWEYAARAGTTTPFAFGATITPQIVNYAGDYPYGSAPKGVFRQKTVDVGSLGVANAFGLYDMHGNLWEWCVDVWHDNYQEAPTDGSAWLSGGDSTYRVLRGGSWYVLAISCRSAYRSLNQPGTRDYDNGLRVVVGARTP